MLLLMSMYQKEFMDSIPDYAIVNTSVEMAKKKKGIKTANFINAVLQNAFSNKRSLNDLKDNERLSIETSHPLWLVNMFMKQYGYETTVKICHSNNEIPKQTGRVNTLKTSIEDVLKNPLYTKSILSKDGVYYSGGNIANSEEFQKGYVTVQDESSQLVAYLLKPYGKVLDMCSAPGSKTAHLAAYMENKGSIDAYDLYEHKINLINQNIERLGVKNVHTHCYDSTLLNTIYDKESFDCILLDAPCSGLGDLRRKPEIRYHDSSIMDELIPLQKKLLENAYDLLAKGGRIVYSTCTINKKENEKQIENFLSNHPDLIKKEEQTILPYEYGSDGFYMCLIEKE
jgi:16S rRNA (cytosine967-C5)-methyltransferase